MTESPLVEANASSLEEIFSSDPLSRSDAEIEKIVSELRRLRDKWRQDEMNGVKRSTAGKAPKKVILSDDIDGLL